MSGVDFRPFRAWRYATNRVELDRVIAPPYDVISSGEQSALYERSPYNVIRLILGREPDFHDEAARRWNEWTREGILTEETRPAFYLYEQTFAHPVDQRKMRRLALVGTLKLETPGAVLAHESTFAGPKQDRLLLFEKTRTNLSPIFGLYPNSKGVLLPLCRAESEKPARFEARDSAGVLHRGWAIEQEADQKKIREALKEEKILIADGHHRYETALEYQKERRRKSPESASEAPFDFVLTALVALEDEGLLVLPTHRILRTLGVVSKEELLNRLRPYFDLASVPEQELYSRLSAVSPKEKVFGGFFGGTGNFLLRLKNLGAIRKFLPEEKPPIWYETEANLLTSLIIRTLWNPPAEKFAEWIGYTHSWEEAARAVREGGAEASFLMRSPKVEAIRELAQAGERMPQKTTYFYPKLADGLFFYHLG